jgi:MoaA/NifB/PqqE/SkfB family radical SAM enzyme
MDRDLYEKIAKDMREAGIKELAPFFIGESMLVPWLPEAIQYAHDLGYFTFLTTNGLQAVESKIRPVFEAKLDSLKFSLNHYSQQHFHDVTTLPGYKFYTVLQNVKNAVKVRDEVYAATGHRCEVNASSIKYLGETKERMDAVLESLIPLLDKHYWLPLFNQGSQTADELQGRGFKCVAGNPGRADCMRKPIPCFAPFAAAHVTYDGMLVLCCFCGNEGWVVGDLKKQTFMAAWHSQKAQDLRSYHLKGDVRGSACEKCVNG